jgi:hypothetical protein
MTPLERRCRWLLRAYPAWYRTGRGDEMLGTLLEASSPDRSWPAARDARALILGGLRTRAWHDQRQATVAALRQAALLAAVLDIAPWSARGFAMDWGQIRVSGPDVWLSPLFGLLALAAMIGAWFGRRIVTAVVALAAVSLWLYQPGFLLSTAVHSVLPFAVLVILVMHRERLPRPWLWLAGVWYLDFLVRTWIPAGAAVGSVSTLALFAIAVGVIVWSVIDARPMLATSLAIAFLYGFAAVQLYLGSLGRSPAFPWDLWPWLVPAVLGVALAVVAIWRLRRQAVL